MDEINRETDILDVTAEPTESTVKVEDEAVPEIDFETVLKTPEMQAIIQKAITQGIQTALKGASPKRNTTDPTATEKAEFDKMTYKERLTLFNTDQNKYNKLIGGIQ